MLLDNGMIEICMKSAEFNQFLYIPSQVFASLCKFLFSLFLCLMYTILVRLL